MSTKIYNGFRVNTGSLAGNMAKLDEFIDPIQKLVDKKNKSLVLRRAWTMLDSLYMRIHDGVALSDEQKDSTEWGVLGCSAQAVRKEQRECRGTQERSPGIDCDVSLFLRVHHPSHTILGYLQEERVGVWDALIAMDGVEDFSYWNNTDQPDDVSDEAWDQRRDCWNEVLDERQACFTLSWEPSFSRLAEEDLCAIPSLEERAHRIAHNTISRQATDELMTEAEKAALKDRACFAGYMRASREAELQLRNSESEYFKKRAALQAGYMTVLLPEITLELLSRDIRRLPKLEGLNWSELLGKA